MLVVIAMVCLCECQVSIRMCIDESYHDQNVAFMNAGRKEKCEITKVPPDTLRPLGRGAIHPESQSILSPGKPVQALTSIKYGTMVFESKIV